MNDSHVTMRPTDRRLALRGGTPVRTEPWPTYDRGADMVDRRDLAAALTKVASSLWPKAVAA